MISDYYLSFPSVKDLYNSTRCEWFRPLE